MVRGLERPDGSLTIEKTRIVDKNCLVADVSGKAKGSVAVLRKRGKYFYVAPKALGGSHEVPADSLTDAVNWSVKVAGRQLARKARRKKK